MNPVSTLNAFIASLLDAVAMMAAKLLPVAGAGVTYTHGSAWRVDAWKEGGSVILQVGGYEACMDFRTAGQAQVSRS